MQDGTTSMCRRIHCAWADVRGADRGGRPPAPAGRYSPPSDRRANLFRQLRVVTGMDVHPLLLRIGVRVCLAQRQRRLVKTGQNQLLLVWIVGDVADRENAGP